jgi:hypothetical protein
MVRTRSFQLLAPLALLLLHAPASAQVMVDPCVADPAAFAAGVASPRAQLSRVVELTGAAPLRPRVLRRSSDALRPHCPVFDPAGEPLFRLLPVSVRAVVNTGYPSDRNDGALWAGRGLSTQLAAGGAFRFGVLSGALNPSASWQQNRPFELAPQRDGSVSEFANPWYGGGLDLPQRFGADPFWTLDPGQSYLRVDVAGVAAGLSSENQWWGPGLRSSLLMSSTAAGIPHLFLGTSAPADIRVGHAEVQAQWGRARHSPYFHRDDGALLVALVAALEPRWTPGLQLGIARAYLQPPDARGFGDLFPFLDPFLKERLVDEENPTGDDPDNQLVSLFVRWAFPAVGFEVWGEWGREDHAWDLKDFLTHPDHSQAYLLGFQKVFTGAAHRGVRLWGELVHLQEHTPPQSWRPLPGWYTHSNFPYTHRGQLIGAWIGPGADAQTLGFDLLHARGSGGLYLERVRRHEQVFWYVPDAMIAGHDTELTGGTRHFVVWRGLDVDVEASYSLRWARDFVRDDHNWSLRAAALWRP